MDVPLEHLVKVLERAASPEVAAQAIRDGLRLCRPIAVRASRECFVHQRGPDGTKWPPLKFGRVGGDGSEQPLRDTGKLMASVTADSSDTVLQVGTNRIQARLMHYGGVVKPVRAKYLAIPATPEAKRIGSPRRFPGLKPLLGEKGGVLVGPVPPGRKYGLRLLPVQYYLVKKTVHLPRPFVGFGRDTVQEVLAMVSETWSRAITQGVRV